MSHHQYNRYVSGNPSSTQGQYGNSSTQAERDPLRASSHLGPGSSCSSSVSSSAIPENSSRNLPSLVTQTVSYRPEQRRTAIDEDIKRSVDMHISRAREEVRVLGKPMHQSIDQGTHFNSAQREEFGSLGTGMKSYPVSSSSASLGYRHSDVEGGSSSLDWLSNYKRSSDNSEFYSSSASSNNASGGDSRFNVRNQRDLQSIPGLGDYDYTVFEKPVTPTESIQPKYSSQSAANILLHFGLEKEDLEHLISYPEDQITPDNLPFILRQIRIQKAKRTTAVGQSKPYLERQPTRHVSEMDSRSLGNSGGARISQERLSSAVPQQSKVIDYGHTSRYTGGAVDELGKSSDNRAKSGGSGSMLPMDSYDSSRQRQEPLQKDTEMKGAALGSLHDEVCSVTSLSTSYRSILKSVSSPSQPNQISQIPSSSFSLAKKDTNIRVLKSEATKPAPLKEPEANRQSMTNLQPSSTLLHGVHPGRTGVVLFDSKNNTKGLSKTQGQASTVAEQMKKQQIQQQMQKQPAQQELKQQPTQQQSKQIQQQMQKQLVSQTGHATWTPVFPSVKAVIPATLVSGIATATQALRHQVFIPGAPHPIIVPPVARQPVPSLVSYNHLMLATSTRQPENVEVSKGLPTPAMMRDYAAASPKVFPHTCCLCKKECTRMKDWISHQNTSLHLENCKRLRTRYTEWDGEVLLETSNAADDAKLSTSTTAQTSQHRHQKTRRDSRSRSRSRSHSRSRSRSYSYSRSRSRSRSRSPSHRHHRGSESRWQKRRSRSRSPYSSRYSRRSRSRSYSQWYDRPTTSRYRSCSSSPERRPSPRRRDFSPRRNEGRRPSPMRSRERRWSPRRNEERRSPQRSRRERRSSTEGSSPQRMSSSAETLAKKLLETSAVQSLTQQSDLEKVVKTLAPALLAELVKMKPSSSSLTGKKDSTSKSSLQKNKPDQSLTATAVRLEGIQKCLSHGDVITAVEHFGKTTSVVLFRSMQEAIVRFEKEEDAKKLRSLKSLEVKGIEVTVFRERKFASAEKKTPSQKKPATSSASIPSGAKKVPSDKLTTKKPAAKDAVKGLKTVTKSKVLVSKAKTISTKPKAKTMKGGKLPVKGAVKKAGVKQNKPPVSTSAASDIQPYSGQFEQKPKPEKLETNVKEPVVKTKVAVDKLTDSAGNESKEVAAEALQNSKAETALTAEKPTSPSDKLASAEAMTTEEVEEMAAKATSMTPKSTPSDNQPQAGQSEQKFIPENFETISKETVAVDELTDSTVNIEEKTSDSKAETASTAEKQTSPSNTLATAGDVTKEKVEETAAKDMTEPMQLGEEEMEVAEPMEVDGCANVKEETQMAPEAVPENSPEKPSESQPSTSSVETSPTETKTIQKVNTQTAAASATDMSTEPEDAASSDQQPATSTSSSASDPTLTIGEMVEKHLDIKKIVCLKMKTCLSPKFFHLNMKQVLITGLPEYYDGCYTEDDIVQLLLPFGFQHEDDNIYIVPQKHMAFVWMPSVEAAHGLITKVRGKNGIIFKGSKICFRVLGKNMTMTSLGFYHFLMKLMNSNVDDDGTRIVLIKNISGRDTSNLRETLRTEKISVNNFLPLINKVFIEFESFLDADRLGVWYSLLKESPGHKVYRQKSPCGLSPSLPPKLSENALPDGKDDFAVVTIPPVQFGVPQGSAAPFWIPMKVSPFVFPTMSPWFFIPDFLTVTEKESIEEASRHHSMIPTVMLTGLPEANYTHQDVAMLVWPYFTKQSLHSLYYNVIVLTLQRRAFVFFSDWTACCKFAQDHITNPVSVKGCMLSVHFVLQPMNPETSEEMLYKTAMKWSNAGVPETETLEERLLCVEINQVSLNVTKAVTEAVASMAPFVSFLPLSNRICIEMADSSGVTQVLEKYKTYLPDCPRKRTYWGKVQRLETVKSLKQHLQDQSEVKLGFGLDTSSVAKCETQLSASEPSDNGRLRVSEHITARPSATDSCAGAMEDDTAVEKIAYAASSPVPPASMIWPEENSAELPQIDEDVLKALTVALRQHRLTRGSRTQSQENVSQDELTPSSEACHFDEQNFNIDDFVTVDEVGEEDVEDTHPHCSSSSPSRVKKERQSSDVSSDSKLTSTRSSDSFKGLTSSTTSTSSSSTSTSASPTMSRDSSEPNKSQTKPSSSVRISKPSSSSTQPSTVAQCSPGQETQQRKTKSPVNAVSSGFSICSSSTATVKASIETHPQQLRDEAKGSMSTVAAEGIAAKTQTETQTDTSSFSDSELTDYVDKHTEDEEDNGTYQIVDSLDEQIDEQMNDGDQDGNSDIQMGPVESFQVLDSVDDEGKSLEENGNAELDGSVQEFGSAPDQSVSDQENIRQVQDGWVPVKQLSEIDACSVVDISNDKSASEDQETNNKDDIQVIECCKTSNYVEHPDGQVPNENRPPQDHDKNVDSKDPDSDVPKQDSFEILDSKDDETATEDDSKAHKTPSDELSEKHIRTKEEEEDDTYEVIDSFEDQLRTTETGNKKQRIKKGEATGRKDARLKSDPTTTSTVSEEGNKSPKKQDKTVKKYQTRRKGCTSAGVSKKDQGINEATEEMLYELVDPVEDKPVHDAATTERPGRRRSARGKKDDKITLNPTEASETLFADEEAPYKILDSVGEETAEDEPILTRRSTRGKRGGTNKTNTSYEKTTKQDAPSRLRNTPPRELQERNREKSADTVEVREGNASYEILDSVEDKVKDDRPSTGRKGKRGRPKKDAKIAIKVNIPIKDDKDVTENMAEEQATYQILDSVDEETVENQSESSRKEEISENIDSQTKNINYLTESIKPNEEEEEEPVYQVVDSLEDDQEDLMATEVSDGGKKTRSNEEASAEKDNITCSIVEETSRNVIITEEGQFEIVDDLEDLQDLCAAEGSRNESASTTDDQKEDKPTPRSQSDSETPEEENKLKSSESNTRSTLVNLDEVSEEEEDYPDDSAEEEELKKRQAATKEKKEQETKMMEEQRTREMEKPIRRSRSRTRRAKERGEKYEEKVEELVTLDEVGADEAEEETVTDIREGEIQTLVTLDEFIEEESGTVEQSTLKTHPLSQEDESTDSFNPEALLTLDEASGDDEEKTDEQHAEETSSKRKRDEDTERSLIFVTVDEVGEEEAVTPRARGRPRKRTRKTTVTVRKSTRGKKVGANDDKDEKEAADDLPTSHEVSLSLDNDQYKFSSDGQLEAHKTEVAAVSQADINAASDGQQLQPEFLGVQAHEGCEEEKNRQGKFKAVNKRRRELVGPQAKRSRSQSPCVAADFRLPAFKPNNPLGREFVVPTSGYFCNLCCLFYRRESTAKDRHCSSQTHYDNLKKHYQRLEQKPSRSSAQSCQGSVSD